jgi:hypothetical protein
MTCLKRTAERIREEAAKGISKDFKSLSTWKLKHGEA